MGPGGLELVSGSHRSPDRGGLGGRENSFRGGQCGSGGSLGPRPLSSNSHDFDDDAFSALAVPFAIENLFPRTQIKVTVGYRQHDLVTAEHPFEVSIRVVFARL